MIINVSGNEKKIVGFLVLLVPVNQIFFEGLSGIEANMSFRLVILQA